MSTLKIKVTLLLLTLGAVAAGIWLATATAQADTMDNQFVYVLHQQGISADGGDATLIKAGHLVCQGRAQGLSGFDVATEIQRYSNLDTWHAGFLVGAAEAAYCPWAEDAGSGGTSV